MPARSGSASSIEARDDAWILRGLARCRWVLDHWYRFAGRRWRRRWITADRLVRRRVALWRRERVGLLLWRLRRIPSRR
jgi:hypothetical protein